ncbi:MAG: hypothetical protein LBL99_03855 [Holosporaceae bacterium]|jgi:hypothetical protein|nr:hypothetical protein [Holosporaceae bacterium]
MKKITKRRLIFVFASVLFYGQNEGMQTISYENGPVKTDLFISGIRFLERENGCAETTGDETANAIQVWRRGSTKSGLGCAQEECHSLDLFVEAAISGKITIDADKREVTFENIDFGIVPHEESLVLYSRQWSRQWNGRTPPWGSHDEAAITFGFALPTNVLISHEGKTKLGDPELDQHEPNPCSIM